VSTYLYAIPTRPPWYVRLLRWIFRRPCHGTFKIVASDNLPNVGPAGCKRWRYIGSVN